jgi:hypothetical protein
LDSVQYLADARVSKCQEFNKGTHLHIWRSHHLIWFCLNFKFSGLTSSSKCSMDFWISDLIRKTWDTDVSFLHSLVNADNLHITGHQNER